MATAASAAAIVIIKMVKKTPSNFPGHKYLLNTIKFMFTLFNISSIAISMVMRFRRVNIPYVPMKNRAVLKNKIWLIGIPFIKLLPHPLRRRGPFGHSLYFDYTVFSLCVGFCRNVSFIFLWLCLTCSLLMSRRFHSDHDASDHGSQQQNADRFKW